eukprot:CAMPEP_0174727466 /NCGR_PEP_ID=MMETSP1094-20130205/49826_1 /TAXON_ID=156173 /ORGANISM="Chrysochromulina brevifilum, Strain UTEX LB 985" /LENGTH=482 /DNA_ID=CAMNT_0015929211 /DNA_START=135 /DNA_END=1580 /DNA_ORIENTATION=-
MEVKLTFKPGAKRRENEEKTRSELTVVLCTCAQGIAAIAAKLGRPMGDDSERVELTDDFKDALQPLYAMLSADVKDVRVEATKAIRMLAEHSTIAKSTLCEIGQGGLMGRLHSVLQVGVLEAIDAMCWLTSECVTACDQVVATNGAIDLVTSYIQQEEDEKAGGGSEASSMDLNNGPLISQERRPRGEAGSAGAPLRSALRGSRAEMAKLGEEDSRTACSSTTSGAGEPGEERQAEERGYKMLSELRGGILPGMTACKPVVKSTERPPIVPVGTKVSAVSLLRNIARSSDANRDAIVCRQVIPQLVKLMTRMAIEDDNKSAISHHSTTQANRRDLKSGEMALDRKTLAADNRLLAELSGQMLETLVLEGKSDVKQHIISAIVRTVQQPGSMPPDDVPALMAILTTAAEEQLSFAMHGDDAATLQSAIEFARWIRVPTIKIGEARNHFKANMEERRRKAERESRRAQLGLARAELFAPSSTKE